MKTLAMGLLATAALAAPALGQISPGALAAPHQHLEGSTNCLECHESGKGVDPEKCLACHAPLAKRVAAGEGLHARPEYADCKTCHIDHHGLEFELVWWGDEGMEALDHQLTGFDLVGAHRTPACRECHRADRVDGAEALRSFGKNLDRTFLGLGSECLSCHVDEHRGQFEGGSCETCHDQVAWEPLRGFDHQQTQFALTGLHREVACEGCHASEGDQAMSGDSTFVQWVDFAFERCEDCHQDPHERRFGADCETCHVTRGWLALDEREFDHRLTRYSLTGRHQGVECASCHRAGEPRRGIPFGSCTDCHQDEHLGQLADRPGAGACEACHDVDGFKPARYSVETHSAVYVLEGAHREVSCQECHKPEAGAELVRLGLARDGGPHPLELTMQLRFLSTQCESCHADPHDSTAAARSADVVCESCHRVAGWQEVAFDHSGTGFALDGPHRALGCAECHLEEESEASLHFGGAATECFACHADPHEGQFDEAEGGVRCERCHAGDTWLPPAGFDHDTDTTYRLEGAHRIAPCEQCHRKELGAERMFTRYLPTPRECSACHDSGS